jgi:hypothetical protein
MAQSALATPPEIDVFDAPADDSEPVKRTSTRGKPQSPDKKALSDESPEDEQQGFFEETSSLTPTDWESHLIYVYQWAPIIDLTRGGTEKKYRRIYNSHKSEEDIKRDLGSGKYELKLNKTDQKTHRERTAKRIVIDILDHEFPPDIPPGPWLDDSRNAQWTWARPLLEKKYNPQKGPNGSAPSWSEMVHFMEANGRRDQGGAKDQLMSSIVQILPQLLAQQNTAQDPSKVITALKEAKEFMSPPAPDGTANQMLTLVTTLMTTLLPAVLKREQDPMVTLLMNQLTEAQKQTTALFQQLISQKTESVKQPSPIEQINQMTDIMTKVAGIIPQTAPVEPWVPIVTDAVAKAGDMAEKFFTLNAMNRSRPQMVQQPQPQIRPVQNGITNPQVQVNAGTPPPPPVSQPVMETSQMDIMQKTVLVMVSQNAAAALQLGMPGDEFADRVVERIGIQTYDEFIRDHPKEQLIPLIMGIPEAWQVLQPFEATLPAFLDSFYKYSEEPEVDEEDAPEAEAAAQPEVNSKKKGKKR